MTGELNNGADAIACVRTDPQQQDEDVLRQRWQHFEHSFNHSRLGEMRLDHQVAYTRKCKRKFKQGRVVLVDLARTC